MQAATARSSRRRCSSTSSRSAFWFDAALLQQPVRRDAAAVRAFLADARANVIVPNRGDELVSARVRKHLQRTQPDWPDLAATADALHMAPSTLQRRLALDGTSFQSLKDELRRDLAIVRLNTSSGAAGGAGLRAGLRRQRGVPARLQELDRECAGRLPARLADRLTARLAVPGAGSACASVSNASRVYRASWWTLGTAPGIARKASCS